MGTEGQHVSNAGKIGTESVYEVTPIWLRKRYLVLLLSFVGFVIYYAMRVDLSVAIVAMTVYENITLANGTVITKREFDWDSRERGFALGAFFYGYIMTQFIGGYVGTKFGGALVFGLGIFGTSVMAVLTPIVCYQGIYYLFAIRVLQGIFSGLSFPSVNDIYAKWSPPMERSRMSGFGISGCFAGAVVAMILSGWLAVNFGWESIFYVFGVLGIIWSIIWFIVVKDCPEKDKCMSENEREFIRNSLKQHGVTNVINPPWKSIFTSMPVYAIVVTHFSYTWGFYTMLTQLPSYMNDMLDFNLQDAGFVSAIPYLALSSLLFISGYLADWLQMNNFLSTTQVRKYFNNLSLFAQMIFLLLAAYFKDPVSIIVCITLSVGLGAFSVSGYLPNPLDIAPQFASIIIGISNTIATIPGLVSPVLTGYIVQTPSESEYRTVFFIASGIYLIGIFFYAIFASGKLQVWAIQPSDSARTSQVSMTKQI